MVGRCREKYSSEVTVKSLKRCYFQPGYYHPGAQKQDLREKKEKKKTRHKTFKKRIGEVTRERQKVETQVGRVVCATGWISIG